MIADTYLFKPITEKVRQVDQFGGYTAGAGHSLYTARIYPKTFWNRTAFVAEPTGHLVGTFALMRDGAGLSQHQSDEPGRSRRRMGRADHGRGRARRQRVGHRLVQLHRAAQPHTRRFPDRPWSGL